MILLKFFFKRKVICNDMIKSLISFDISLNHILIKKIPLKIQCKRLDSIIYNKYLYMRQSYLNSSNAHPKKANI